jgi:hypothetical protein
MRESLDGAMLFRACELPTGSQFGSEAPFVLNGLASHVVAAAMVTASSVASSAQAPRVPRVFASAVRQISPRVTIPLLVPSRLPSPIGVSQIRATHAVVSDTGYFISLFYGQDESDAYYAAGIGGSTKVVSAEDLPGASRVALAHGVTGFFRPVSCGGSCAPANLWWICDGVQYQIQVKLSPDLAEATQAGVLVSMANSVVIVRALRPASGSAPCN